MYVCMYVCAAVTAAACTCFLILRCCAKMRVGRAEEMDDAAALLPSHTAAYTVVAGGEESKVEEAMYGIVNPSDTAGMHNRTPIRSYSSSRNSFSAKAATTRL